MTDHTPDLVSCQNSVLVLLIYSFLAIRDDFNSYVIH